MITVDFEKILIVDFPFVVYSKHGFSSVSYLWEAPFHTCAAGQCSKNSQIFFGKKIHNGVKVKVISSGLAKLLAVNSAETFFPGFLKTLQDICFVEYLFCRIPVV